MLDLLAAFDTLDHTIMLDWLRRMYGIDEQALKWISSYLDSRTQSVHVNGSKSQPKTMTFAMPQGSVLGAVFYVYYSKPVGLIIRSHKMEYHCYADDSQLYIVINQANVNETIHRVENCVSDIQTWMERNLLKLNEDKTEIILFSKKSMENLFGNISLSFGGSVIQPVKKVKNLGCWLDNTLSMDTHAQAIVRSCYFQLRKIQHIRQYLSDDALRTIIHSLVISKLDYGNALLAGAPKTVTNKLQRVQHMAARVVAGLRKRDHITDTMCRLHWLPVRDRIQFKVLLLTFKALNNLAPEYMSELLTIYTPSRSLRSTNQPTRLLVPRTNRVTYSWCFYAIAPTLWNNLPDNLKKCTSVAMFKCMLKTFVPQVLSLT